MGGPILRRVFSPFGAFPSEVSSARRATGFPSRQAAELTQKSDELSQKLAGAFGSSGLQLAVLGARGGAQGRRE